MKTHWQNLNEDGDSGKVIGSGFWAGRAWLYFTNKSGTGWNKQIGLEWSFGAHAHHTGLTFKTRFVMDREIVFHLGLTRLFCFFLSIAHPSLPSWSYKHGDREIGLAIFDNALWLYPWNNPDGWERGQRNSIRFSPMDKLLGKWTYSEHKLSEHQATVNLPDGEFPAHIDMMIAIRKRSRWPFANRTKLAHVKLLKPIPIPGKGENSWDMDDSAIMELYCNASTIEEAIGHVVQSALRDRRRYGGSLSWKPGE